MAAGDLWLAGNIPNGIYRSTDDGATWSSLISPPSGQTIVTGIAVAPNGDLWLAGVLPNGIYRSTDDGATWSSLISPPAGQTGVTGIDVALNGDLWLAGSSPDDIYRSTDDGATWSSGGISAPSGQTIVTGIAVAPNGDLWLAGSSPDGIYRSTDDGATWSSLISPPSGQTSVTGIAVAPNGDLWLAGSSPDDIYRSTDDGATWSSSGISAPSGQTVVRGIAFDPRVVPAFADDTGDAVTWTVGTAIDAITVPEASGTPAPTYAVEGNLPSGLSFDDSTRQLTGTPEAAGTGTIVIRATNSAGIDDYSISYTISSPPNVAPTVTIDTTATTIDAGATLALAATADDPDGTIASYAWTGQGNFNPADSGDTTWTAPSPAAQMAYTLRLTVTDDDGAEAHAEVMITVRAALTTPSFADDTGDAISGTVGTAIAAVGVPAASGNPAPTYAAVGNLPAGLNFNTGTRVLSGTPTAAGSGTIRIRATNSEGDDDWTVTYSFAAALAAPVFADDTGDAISGTVGTAIASVTVPAATGNPAPTYAQVGTVAGVSFDTGSRALSFDESAIEAGTGTITVRASNSEGDDDWTVAYSFAAAGSPLVLANLNDAGLVVDCKALIEAGEPPHLWRIRDDVFQGTLLDGEFGLNLDRISVEWLRRRADTFSGAAGGTHITLNDDDPTSDPDSPVHLGNYFVSPAGGAEDTLTIMNEARETVSFSAGDRRAAAVGGAGGDRFVTFAVPNDHHAFVAAIAEGQRFIFRLARSSAVEGDANAANFLFNVPDATGATVAPSFSGDAEAANWEFDVPEASAQHTPPGNDGIAVAISWEFDVPATAVGETVPPAFDGDASAEAWAFQVPEATGATVPPSVAGNAAATNWLFDVPDAEGATVPPNFAGDADAANWLFNVPNATGLTGIDGEANAANFLFNVPDARGSVPIIGTEGDALAANWSFEAPAVIGSTVPPAFDGDGLAASWAFQIPTATGFTVPPGSGGVPNPVNWTFQVPDATGQTVVAPGTGGNAEAANWTFNIPDATGRTAAPQGGAAKAVNWTFTTSDAVGASGMLADNGDATDIAWAFQVPAAEGSAAAARSSPPLFPRLEAGAGAMCLDLLWEPPLDDGGGEITRYEAFICDEVGQNCGFETVGADGTRRHRIRGLRRGGLYRVRMRAINAAGTSDESEEVEASPYLMPATITPPPGAALPLIDADRQSLIVRLDNRDCRVTVWWQPSDESWYAMLEVPTNTVIVSGKRLALNAGILDRLEGDGVLPGNLVCREIGESGLDPARDAWRSGNYALKWEPDGAS